MKLELRRRGMHVIDADNDVYNGIEKMCNEMAIGNLSIMKECKNLIREIQNYVWDTKKSIQGEDEPVKKGDHAIDALRYAIATHKINKGYDGPDHNPNEYVNNRFKPTR